MIRAGFLIALPLALAGCATPPGPVEVTRFVADQRVATLGDGIIFVAGEPSDPERLENAPYIEAVARELAQLGYQEGDRSSAAQVAEVRIERYGIGPSGRRGPVSVGVGGSTGSYGSGVGLGVGINLGGGGGPKLGTEMAVTIRDKASGEALWEGRADFAVSEKSALARGAANAQTLAAALFREFPGNSGETVQVEVSE